MARSGSFPARSSGALFPAPLTFLPQLVAKPWGGSARLRRFGISVPPSPPTGEVWLVSDVEGRASVVASGPHAGKTLRELVRDHRSELLGATGGRSTGGRSTDGIATGGSDGAGSDVAPERFPLLVKLLEVEGKLSVQVHPDGAQARRNGDGLSGKFEAWAVLDASPGARVSLGLERALAHDDVRSLVAADRLHERLNTFPPQAGDAYVIWPGTIHAATGGVLFLEVQETADVTYRLYDWGARGLDGLPRELHVEKALACADLANARAGAPPRPEPRPIAAGVVEREIVGAGAPFSFDLLDLEAGARFPIGGDGAPWVFVGLKGRAQLTARAGSRGEGSITLEVGQAALWPAALATGELVAKSPVTVARARATPGS